MKKTLLTLFLGIFLISFVNTVSLDTDTILNTTVSNSSMTFTIPANVRNLTVENNSIYLYWVTYTQEGISKFCTSINHTDNNTNLDSADFNCTAEITGIGAGTGAGSTTIEKEEIVEDIIEEKKGIKEHILNNLILYLIIVLGIIFLILNIGDKKEQSNLNRNI